LVDWNWVQIGDRRTDLAAMLTYVYRSGLDVLPTYANRLDADALHWIAGFWLHAATKPYLGWWSRIFATTSTSVGNSALDLMNRIIANNN